MDAIIEELTSKTEQIEFLETTCQALLVKERKANDELQEARKELIPLLRGNSSGIGVKVMGLLDDKPFHSAARTIFPDEEASTRADTICSLWKQCLRDPRWHPFKIITVGENAEEVIDESDIKLMALKRVCGEDAYQAVITALMELNQYDPSGRHPVEVLWNFREGRKATLKEAIGHILEDILEDESDDENEEAVGDPNTRTTGLERDASEGAVENPSTPENGAT